MAKDWQIAGLVAMVVFILGGCAGNVGPIVRRNYVDFSPAQLREVENFETYEYRLQTEDVLKIAFADEAKLNPDAVKILPDGSVSLAGIDRIKLAGLTVTEADSLLTAEYSKQFRDPRVTVIVLETSGRQVYVLGEVRNPGMVKLQQGGIDPIAAVTLAGGFTPDASADSAVLVRVSQTGYMVEELNLSNLDEISSMSLAMVQLKPFDVIYVPRTRIGDFSYFAKSVLTGLVQVTRLASDLKYMSGNTVRY